MVEAALSRDCVIAGEVQVEFEGGRGSARVRRRDHGALDVGGSQAVHSDRQWLEAREAVAGAGANVFLHAGDVESVGEFVTAPCLYRSDRAEGDHAAVCRGLRELGKRAAADRHRR